MRRRLALAALTCLVFAACGDDIDEGANEGRDPRGTIDGVPLDTAGTVAPATTDATGPNDTGPNDTGPDDTRPPADDPFGWTDLGDGSEEGYLEVPLDYGDPNGETVLLYLVRHAAVDPANRIGSLLVNPGGPGYGGSSLAASAEGIYGQDLLDRFDIIGWDPRGTGYSEPYVDCVDDYDQFFGLDSSPDSPEERQALIDAGTDFGEGCLDNSGDLLPHLSTENSARDMDAIREALGEETISYFGFSYGSELGATWATMFPETVRAAVLDGAVDPTVGYLEQNIQQAAGFEATFNTFLAQCSAEPSCAFHNDGDAEGAFDALSAAVDADPVRVDRDRTDVTQGVLMTAVADAMYDQGYWPQLEQALADLQDGDGQGILDLYDDYYGYYGSGWDDSLEAYFAIGCLDDPGSTGPDDLYSHEAEFAAAAPRLGRGWMAELTFCSVWPIAPVTPVEITGKGAGPILVVGTTGDPATPLDSTRNMARALEDGHLVVVEADQHTGYGVNSCGDDAVDSYLVDPTIELATEIDCT
ncbi:MAG: alpha/beta hydrolase [Actinomycetota bacterium]|nr:alpha/beta hydrolase [Actinomycetota bacterium]